MKIFRPVLCFLLIAACCLSAMAQSTPEVQKIPVILDTDIGDDIDDAYAVTLLLALPNAKLLGITTSYGETTKKAELTARLLQVMGYHKIPIFAGRKGAAKIGRQYEWSHSGSQQDATGKDTYPAIRKEDAVTFLHQELNRTPGKITLIAIGPLTNIGDLITRFPETRRQVKQIVIMGGSVYRGYNDQPPPVAEYNIQMDPTAAKVVFESGIPITMAGLEVTTSLKLDLERQKKLFSAGSRTTDALAALTNIWGGSIPTLYDPVAVAWALTGRFCRTERLHLNVDSHGMTVPGQGEANVTLLTNVEKDEFLNWAVETIRHADYPSNRADQRR